MVRDVEEAFEIFNDNTEANWESLLRYSSLHYRNSNTQ